MRMLLGDFNAKLGLEAIFKLTIGTSKNLEIKIYKTVSLPVVLYGCET